MLRLRHSPLSPFVRKVLVAAHELGLADRIELVPTNVWAEDTDIHEDNPLGKVPALRTDQGVFVGSALICDYLDHLGGRRLIPAEVPARWRVLQLHALADGILEAAVAHVVERLRRPAEARWEGHLARQETKIRRTLDRLEAMDAPASIRTDAPLDLGGITLACALAYLDFRLPDLAWRSERPRLAAWLDAVSVRPSLRATAPPAPA